LAWVLFYIVIAAQGYKIQLPLLSPYKFAWVEQREENVILVGKVAENSPANKSGLESNDRIYALNGQKISNVDYLIQLIKENAGKEISLVITDIQGNNKREVKIVPRENPPANEGALGISLGGFSFAELTFEKGWQKALSGPIHSYNIATYSYSILADTVAYSFAKRDITPVSQSVAGPIGITNIVKEILSIKNPLIPYLDFMAALSLNLAIVNILPFPGLDGGRFLFLIIEAVTRKKVHETIEKYVHTIGFAILLSLIVLLTISDLKKLLPF